MRSLTCLSLALSLTLLSPGLEPYRLFAQVRTAPAVEASPLLPFAAGPSAAGLSGTSAPLAELPALGAFELRPLAALSGAGPSSLGAAASVPAGARSAGRASRAASTRSLAAARLPGAPARPALERVRRFETQVAPAVASALGQGASPASAFAAGRSLEDFMTGAGASVSAPLEGEAVSSQRALRTAGPSARSERRSGLAANGQDPLLRYEPPTDKNSFRRFLRRSYESHPALSLTIGLAVGGALFLTALAGPFYFIGEVAAPMGKALIIGGALVNLAMGPLIQKAGRTGKWILGTLWQAPAAASGLILLQMGLPLQGTLLLVNALGGINFIRKRESGAEDELDRTMQAAELAAFVVLTGLQLVSVAVMGLAPGASTAALIASTVILASMGGFAELFGLFAQAAGFAPMPAAPARTAPLPDPAADAAAWLKRHLLPVSLAASAAVGMGLAALAPIGPVLSLAVVLGTVGTMLALRGAYQHQIRNRASDERKALAGVALVGLGLGGLAAALFKAFVLWLHPGLAFVGFSLAGLKFLFPMLQGVVKRLSYQDWQRADEARGRLLGQLGYWTAVDLLGVEVKEKEGAYVLIVHVLDGYDRSAAPTSFEGHAVDWASHGPSSEADRKTVAGAKDFAKWNKGLPYSQTEYSMALYYAQDAMEKRGASGREKELFDATQGLAPLRGGRFNSWSGD